MREETWYALHVFSGYEQKIERQILSLMQSNSVLSKSCHDVKVPMVITKEMKDGKEKERKRKLMPGYVLVDLDLPKFTEDEEKHKEIVQLFKSIDGVTGFVNGTTARGSHPAVLTKAEMNKIKEEIGEIKVVRPVKNFQVFNIGDEVNITAGPFEGFSGKVEDNNLNSANKLRVQVEVFGRINTIEVESQDVELKQNF